MVNEEKLNFLFVCFNYDRTSNGNNQTEDDFIIVHSFRSVVYNGDCGMVE